MKIKKITAPTLKKATEIVKTEFGSEAIILSSRIVEDDVGNRKEKYFELTIGLEPEMDEIENTGNFLKNEHEEKLKLVNNIEDRLKVVDSKKLSFEKTLVNASSKAEEFYHTNSTVQNKITKHEIKEIVDLLKHNEVDTNIIKILMDQLQKSKHLLTKDNLEKNVLISLSSLINTTELNIKKTGKPKIVSVIGPTGVGKTTCIAKLAAITKILNKLDIGVITIDTFRLGAIDQLKIFSEISNIDLLVAYEESDIPQMLEKFKNKDLIFIDTIGRSQKNKDELLTIKKFLDLIPIDETYLAISATTSKINMFDVAEKFKIFNYNSLIFTKIDEAITYGNILNVSLNFSIPLVYMTNGQVIPDDIVAADSDFIAKIIYTGMIN